MTCDEPDDQETCFDLSSTVEHHLFNRFQTLETSLTGKWVKQLWAPAGGDELASDRTGPQLIICRSALFQQAKPSTIAPRGLYPSCQEDAS